MKNALEVIQVTVQVRICLGNFISSPDSLMASKYPSPMMTFANGISINFKNVIDFEIVSHMHSIAY